MAHLTHDLLRFIRDWLPLPPARVLDVGCGDGSLTRRLAADGYRILGIDPDAPPGEEFERSAIEDFRAPERFDAAVAVRSLHHVHALEAALSSIRLAIGPSGRLVLYEFALESFEADAERWIEGHGLQKDWDIEGVIRLAELRQALDQRFRLLFEQPTAYLARELDRADLVKDEEAAIERGNLKPAGMRLVYELPGI
ncbi:MAG: class I SAM-dependent methyltransferase [Solirubrobacterales bacterium]